MSTPTGIPEPTVEMIIRRRPFTPIGGMPEVVEEFHFSYLQNRIAGRTDAKQIFREFRKNKELEGIWFNPYENQLKTMLARWEKELPPTIRKIAIRASDTKTRTIAKKAAVLRKVEYDELETGAKSLQMMLVEDAQKLINESNDKYQAVDEEGGEWDKTDHEKIRLKKKEIALAITGAVLAGVQKHQLVKLKANKEGRETAGFMMDLIRRSATGEVSDEELAVLEGGIE